MAKSAAAAKYSIPVPAATLLAWLKEHQGASTLEMKTAYVTSSKEIRIALGKLMANNKVIPMPLGRGVGWMLVTGQRGRPNIHKARAEWAYEREDGKPETEVEADLNDLPAIDTVPGKSRIRDPHGNETQIKTDTSRKVGKVTYARNPDEEG